MQKLHLVGFTTELDGLILSARKGSRSGSFVVPIDDGLLEAVVDAVRRREADRDDGDKSLSATAARLAAAAGAHRPRHDSALSVREMQERLRSGLTVEQVADEAGVDVEWVSRFAPPVLAEQARVVARARGLVFEKPRVGPSRVPLGDSVVRNVAAKGVRLTEEELDQAWTGHQVQDDLWAIRFTYVSRNREQEAVWLLDLDAGELSAGNRLASQLGHVAGGARAGRARAAKQAGSGTATRRKATGARAPTRNAAGRKAATKRAAGRKVATKRAATKKAAAKRAATKKAAAKRASGKKAATKRASGKRAATKRAAGKKAPAKRAAGKRAAPRKSAARRAGAAARKSPAKRASAKKQGSRRTAGRKTAGRRAPRRSPPGRQAPTLASATRRTAAAHLAPQAAAAPWRPTPLTVRPPRPAPRFDAPGGAVGRPAQPPGPPRAAPPRGPAPPARRPVDRPRPPAVDPAPRPVPAPVPPRVATAPAAPAAPAASRLVPVPVVDNAGAGDGAAVIRAERVATPPPRRAEGERTRTRRRERPLRAR